MQIRIHSIEYLPCAKCLLCVSSFNLHKSLRTSWVLSPILLLGKEPEILRRLSGLSHSGGKCQGRDPNPALLIPRSVCALGLGTMLLVTLDRQTLLVCLFYYGK